MSVAVSELRIEWISQVDGSLRMRWTCDGFPEGRNGLKAGRYGR